MLYRMREVRLILPALMRPRGVAPSFGPTMGGPASIAWLDRLGACPRS
jgi:hypothetical protein